MGATTNATTMEPVDCLAMVGDATVAMGGRASIVPLLWKLSAVTASTMTKVSIDHFGDVDGNH